MVNARHLEKPGVFATLSNDAGRYSERCDNFAERATGKGNGPSQGH